MNSTIERIALPYGVHLTRIVLRNESNRWVGNIILEHGIKTNEHGEFRKSWGRYYSITDYGNYAYAWFYIGKVSFEQFVYEMAARDSGYFIDKLCKDESCVYRHKETKELALEQLNELYNDGSITKNEYEEYIDRLEETENEQEMNDWYNECLDDPNGYEGFVYGLSNQAENYKNNVFPLLAEVLRDGVQNGD